VAREVWEHTYKKDADGVKRTLQWNPGGNSDGVLFEIKDVQDCQAHDASCTAKTKAGMGVIHEQTVWDTRVGWKSRDEWAKMQTNKGKRLKRGKKNGRLNPTEADWCGGRRVKKIGVLLKGGGSRKKR